MFIRLESGDIVNTRNIDLISRNKVYFVGTTSNIPITDKDIENIIMSEQPYFILKDYKLEDCGGIFKTAEGTGKH